MGSIRHSIGQRLAATLAPMGYMVKGGTQDLLPLLINPLLKPFNVRVVRRRNGTRYIDCRQIVKHAAASGLSVIEFLTQLWNEEGVIQNLINQLAVHVPFANCRRITEIGPGTGRYLEPIMRHCRPELYEIYETDKEWARYLAQRDQILVQPADGKSLAETPSSSRDLVHAHYVMVYIPITTTFSYLEEMCRITDRGGFVLFDAHLDSDCNLAEMREWQMRFEDYQHIIPRAAVCELFCDNGFSLVDDSIMYQQQRSRYLIFQKGRGD